MSSSHSKLTVITVATKDLSQFTTNSRLTRGGTSHSTTGYGVDDETSAPGIRKSAFEMEGWYDNTVATSPRGTLKGAVQTIVAIVRKPEGTGTGKPNEAFSAVVEEYVESSPITDIVRWSAKFTVTGPIVDTVQT